MTIYDALLARINEAAEVLGADGKEFKSEDVKNWLKVNRSLDWPTLSTSFVSNYSWAVTSDPTCKIRRVPGKFLYRLVKNSVVESPDQSASVSDTLGGTSENDIAPVTIIKNIQREAKLYAALQSWLSSRGYQAQITSASKVGGIWGNPDVVGLRLDELPIGPAGLECATVEAKLSSADWRYYFFEAVAHKRFAHRAWFAFAVGTDEPDLGQLGDAASLCEYAEKYGVGILVVFIAKSDYEMLTKGDPTNLDLGLDDVRVDVLWPAPYEAVRVSSLSTFLKNVLGIHNHNDLGKFGRSQ